MLNLNKVELVGYVGKSGVNLKFGKTNGTAIGTFSVSVPKESKDKEKKEYEYYNVISFKNTAEFLANNADRIKSVYVEGKLQSRSYDKEVGGETIKIYVTEIIANRVQVVEWNNNPTTEAADTSNNTDGMTEIDDSGDIPF
jgi:single-strand DNA-binding protein